jgi:hypothetical protein
MTVPTPNAEEFRRRTLAQHKPAADLHRSVSAMLETAVQTPRLVADIVQRAVDMLFVQAFKAHQSVFELSAVCLTEDAATIVRRLLELAAQAAWIAKESDADVRNRRAGMYLAFLWVKWPSDLRDLIPADERLAWEAVVKRYGATFTAERKQWGPTFSQIFDALEESDTEAGHSVGGYRDTYRYLSNVAHGSPPSLVHSYSSATVQIHDGRFVSDMLIFGTLYALATASIWNDIYEVIPQAEFAAVQQAALSLAPTVPQ